MKKLLLALLFPLTAQAQFYECGATDTIPTEYGDSTLNSFASYVSDSAHKNRHVVAMPDPTFTPNTATQYSRAEFTAGVRESVIKVHNIRSQCNVLGAERITAYTSAPSHYYNIADAQAFFSN